MGRHRLGASCYCSPFLSGQLESICATLTVNAEIGCCSSSASTAKLQEYSDLLQLEPQVREAILGNTGTIISFRLGVTDAEILEKEFCLMFSMRELVGLPNYHIYLKLMINGAVSEAFSARTLQPAGLDQAILRGVPKDANLH